MAMVYWNPWREMDSLQRQLDRLFEDTVAPTVRREWKNFARVPAAEMQETDEAVLLKLELPGINLQDLDVQVTEDTVSIKGERKAEAKTESNTESNGVVRSEFYYGSFQRVIPLPTKIQNTKVEADYKDGILHLTLPKTEAVKHQVVKVNLASAKPDMN